MRPRTSLLLSLAAVLLGLAALLLVPDLRHALSSALHGDTGELRRQLRGAGVGGALILLATILGHVAIPYPAEIPLAAAGFVYGFWLALPLVLLFWAISASCTYALGRYAGRPALERLAGEERLTRLGAAMERGGIPFLLAARLIPLVPYSLVGYVSGATGVPFARFLWTTVVGSLPLFTAVTLLGSRLQSFSASDPLVYVALVPVIVLLAVARPLARHLRVTDPAADGPAG